MIINSPRSLLETQMHNLNISSINKLQEIQMDNLNLKVCATQNMLDLTGLPHAAGRDMGMIWDNPNPDHAHLDMDPKNRPMYPAFINYLRMAKVVLEEMRKDGVFQ